MESLWELVDAIIYTHRRAVVCLHDVLHGFRTGRGSRTDTLELNMVQELDSMDQDPMFRIFLYLRNAYDNLDCVRILTTLEGYGDVP